MITLPSSGKLFILTGPNGSGKSTWAREVIAKRKDVFLGFQQPVTVPGVSYLDFLRLASRTKLGPVEFYRFLKEKAKILDIPEEFLTKNLNENLSGGEKKKMEFFQALVLNPKFAIFDEIEAGLDSKNLKVIIKGIKTLQKNGTGIVVITHSKSLIKALKPNKICLISKQ